MVLTRIHLAQQKLNETNLNEGLRERAEGLTECKFEIKQHDQELIMIKIENALLKCQIEEVDMEAFELERAIKIIQQP